MAQLEVQVHCGKEPAMNNGNRIKVKATMLLIMDMMVREKQAREGCGSHGGQQSRNHR